VERLAADIGSIDVSDRLEEIILVTGQKKARASTPLTMFGACAPDAAAVGALCRAAEAKFRAGGPTCSLGTRRSFSTPCRALTCILFSLPLSRPLVPLTILVADRPWDTRYAETVSRPIIYGSSRPEWRSDWVRASTKMECQCEPNVAEMHPRTSVNTARGNIDPF
jgi:hypothetical protein